jgi:colanic acid biosynthesis glycosyl transferase WcaI
MKVLLLNQCFWPDVMATAQQLTDLARGLAERGHEVTVITSRRGYDDPRIRFPRRERWHNINIVRMRTITMGKSSRWRRAVNFASFLSVCAFRLIFTGQCDVVIALTSPPLISWLASWFTQLKGGRLVFWVMDLNPDEAIAAGWLRPDSMTAKVLAKFLLRSMRQAAKIIALDRFMKERMLRKGINAEKIEVIPPWSQDDAISFDQQGREAFRRTHGLAGKFVVMYAGNHSPCHPLDTLLEAAEKLSARTDIAFCFVGGGSEQRKVEDFARVRQLENIRCLPYQPQEELSAVLSAADLHVVVMGEAFPGIVHPCKVYNILTIGTPFLYLGPRESHMGDIIAGLTDPKLAMQAEHGQSALVSQFILNAAQESIGEKFSRPDRLRREQTDLARSFAKSTLLPKLIAEVEALVTAPGARPAETPAAKLQSA